jgi:hypothetical protein
VSRRAGVVAFVLLVCCAGRARGQDWLLAQTIVDGEMWATDSGSRMLSVNDGHPAPAGRAQLFLGAAAGPVQLLFMGEVEHEAGAEEDEEFEFDYDLLTLRFVASPLAVIDVGRFPTPIGAFANRRFSTINPLIGMPDMYSVTYPWGVELSGTAARIDYRAAIVNLPATREGYTPDPSPRLRPALGAGFTPVPELRIGGSATWGSYLNDTLTAVIPAGSSWTDYAQRILAFDTRFSRGYFELHGELAFSRYDVPTKTATADGTAYYLEAKQTWTPRFFTAVRGERNDYPFIRPVSATNWIARNAVAYNAELGVGFRATREILLKASYRGVWYDVDPSVSATFPDGYALAVQFSYNADIKSWFERRR